MTKHYDIEKKPKTNKNKPKNHSNINSEVNSFISKYS